MDTCYFGRGLGVMIFRDHLSKENIYWKYVKHETINDYLEGLGAIRQAGCNILAAVCDGKKGLMQSIKDMPVQMCQFHQVAIVTRYLTRKPQLPAAIELKRITTLLVRTDKESFIGILNEWKNKWKQFLKEKTINIQTGKWQYTHRRLRSAVRSLAMNLPYLFTWYDNPALNIPNTTNSLEGIISDLKKKVFIHNGLKLHRKQKLINQILAKNQQRIVH